MNLDADLRALTGQIAEMGGLAESQVSAAVRALLRGDRAAAQTVIDGDTRIDALERRIEDKSVSLIALRQPVAQDLRAIVTALRTSHDLERVGDLAKNIAKRTMAMNGEFKPKQLETGVDHLAGLALEQLKNAIDAYTALDPGLAFVVRNRDEDIDALYTSLFRELLTYMMEDPRSISTCTHLLFCAKNIERIGDHATNIAETVEYLVHGRGHADERPKGDRSYEPDRSSAVTP